MGLLAAILALALVALVALGGFLRADPQQLARSFKLTGPFIAGLAGTALLFTGRPLFGGLILVAAIGWYSLAGRKRVAKPASKALVRTAALEMETEPKTGKVEGLVLAGRQEGRILGSMDLKELRQLHRELVADPDSQKLLEMYLDGRFPVWREDAQPNRRKRLRVAPGPGSMTKEEAYEILGLEAGAAATDILEAHRRLMQSLGSDVGDGTSVLAARLNEAKDVLLSNHD
ncbi:molecular chaperone DnaJ [Mesorhizobium sp. Root157]|uniref:hypothetical protein n=1 Tax=Mesorhizobium sp. Root157 TaxID=1736477 RepID=UPI0006FCCA0A|nr:hypothetical protein [Mesorhizobium sp. Root157]KQZ99630.1 molecular chaperone DnaJ [Mesorhizobium sp. Root157]